MANVIRKYRNNRVLKGGTLQRLGAPNQVLICLEREREREMMELGKAKRWAQALFSQSIRGLGRAQM